MKQKEKRLKAYWKRIGFALFCIGFTSLVVCIVFNTMRQQSETEINSDCSDPPTYSDHQQKTIQARNKALETKRQLLDEFIDDSSDYFKSAQKDEPTETEEETDSDEVIDIDICPVEAICLYTVEAVCYEDRYLAVARAQAEDTETETPESVPEETAETKKMLEVPEDFVPIVKYTTKEGWIRDFPFSVEMQYWTYKMCQKYDLPYKIILGVLGAETHWNEDPAHTEIYSGTLYIGIGCLSEKYHAANYQERGIDIYTVEGNIEALCDLIRGHTDVLDGNVIYGVMAFNRGRNGARKLINEGETSTGYTDIVINYAESFVFAEQ